MHFNVKKIVAAALSVSALSSLTVLADDSNIELVRALVSKGVLTEEEGALLTKGRAEEMDVQKKKEKKAWTGHVNIRGYVQTRTNSMLGGDKGINLWSDRSIGDDNSLGNADKNFLVRRARVIIFGDYGDHLSYYIQPDFTNNGPSANQAGYAQLRDVYGDINIDKTKVHRVRVGLSKIPFGFENMQSSSNRLAPDRADALNSAARDERDLGAFYYYTPETTQALFEEINKSGLKHSGNYGMFALGAYNGQGANRFDRNDNYHLVSRFTYPWKTESGQIYEAGIQAYRGNFVVDTGAYRTQLNAAQTLALNATQPAIAASAANSFTATAVGCGTVATAAQQSVGIRSTCNPRIANGDRNGIRDERIGVSFMMYPQPFGLQAEWNWGKTPGLDIEKNVIEEQNLMGGYVQAMYMLKDWNNWGTFTPYVRWQYFDGYNKAETNAPQNNVNDWEWGLEWQIAPEVEISAEYHHMKRNNLVTGAGNNTLVKSDYESFKAEALRVQLQFNY
jgi:hypothetical protein